MIKNSIQKSLGSILKAAEFKSLSSEEYLFHEVWKVCSHEMEIALEIYGLWLGKVFEITQGWQCDW